MTVVQLPTRTRASQQRRNVALSIVLPVKDEAGSLRQLIDEIRAAIKEIELDGEVEIFFVDDGSNDGSAKLIEEFVREDRSITLIQFRRNFGKSAALAAGFKAACGDYVVTMDTDLQDVPGQMGKLLEPLQSGEADLVSGWKTPRRDPWTKTAPSTIFNLTVRLLTGIPLHDFNCGYKAYRYDVLDELQLYGEMHRYIPVLAHFRGFKVVEVPVRHRPRKFGRSKFGIERTFRGFFDLMTVLFLNHYTRRPLHLFGWLGLLALGSGFAINAYLAILKLGFGEPIGHRPLLTLGVLLMVMGGQFVMFGLLGEMLAHQSRISSEERGRRSIDYSIRRVLRHDDLADD